MKTIRKKYQLPQMIRSQTKLNTLNVMPNDVMLPNIRLSFVLFMLSFTVKCRKMLVCVRTM